MKVCPSCGSTEVQKQFVGAFCVDCFAKKELFTLKEFAFQLCSRCGRVKQKEQWVSPSHKTLSDILRSKIKSDKDFDIRTEFTLGKTTVDAKTVLTFHVDGSSVRQERVFEIPLEKKLCLECGRITGSYHEAIIQLRGDPEVTARVARKLERILGENIVKTEEKREGNNYFIITKQLAFSALSTLKLRHSLSHKLVGVKEGKRVFKITLLVRVNSPEQKSGIE
ncbi:TPA: hypothetical protein HA244_04680 [Candidatus Micrarchaeota archaeon]|nr:hypothetical protein [Candidatus Micrarchaeota archaeon]